MATIGHLSATGPRGSPVACRFFYSLQSLLSHPGRSSRARRPAYGMATGRSGAPRVRVSACRASPLANWMAAAAVAIHVLIRMACRRATTSYPFWADQLGCLIKGMCW